MFRLHAPNIQTGIDYRAAQPAAEADPKGKRCPRCGGKMPWGWCEPCRAKDDADCARVARKFRACKTKTMGFGG